MPVPEIEDPEALSTDTRMLHGAPSERLGGALKRPKPGGEGPLTSSNLHAVAAALHPSASTAASGVSLGTASGRASPGRTSEAAAAASEAAKGALEEAAKGTAATEAAPNDGILSRNRISSGRHGERIACPMDSSHSIYALRVQAHLKKCTKARDIAFSHCLPFMHPGANLPQQQRLDQSEQQRQEDHLQQKLQHGDYVESPETAAALTSEFEAKISDAYRYSLLYLNNMSPKEAATAETAAATPPTAKAPVGAAVPQWDSLEKLPASIFIMNCCSGVTGERHSEGEEEALLLLRAAADATQVPLDTGTAAAEGPPLAWLEADLKRALLLPQQDRSSAILQVLQQLQQRLNKHQKQLLQLLALCLLHSHLQKSSLDETLIVELGAGKGDLTRWLCCWSAVAVAANAQRESAASAPQVPAAAAAAGAPGALHTHAPRQHRGVRCIVVDREARRYCKEAKDKTFRNPNSLRPLHPAAVAAAERRKAAAAATVETAVEENTSLRNPLLGEEMTAGPAASALSDPAQTRTVGDAASSVIGRPPQALASLTPAATGTNASCSNPASTSSSGAALPVPPVRLRMDIADFSLVALVKYIACKGPLRVPHIPGFFKKLFEYGCRFAVPKPRLEQEGAKETRGERCKVNGDGMHSLANVAEATNVGEEEPNHAAKRGPKPRILRCVEDGSAEEFFAIAQTLGEGGGPSMKRIDDVLGEHFRGRCTSNVLGVAKHLCGGGSDVALRCFASARDATESRLKFCVCIATCCHHRCTTESFVGTEFLLSQGFTLTEISLLFSLSGWATGATDRKREIGNMVKRILDISRIWWLRQEGFTTATLQQFVESEETPECFAIVAHSHSGAHRD